MIIVAPIRPPRTEEIFDSSPEPAGQPAQTRKEVKVEEVPAEEEEKIYEVKEEAVPDAAAGAGAQSMDDDLLFDVI